LTAADAGDPVEARRLLAEAGYPNGISLKFAYPLYGAAPLDVQSIQASLSRAGIDVQLIPFARNAHYALMMNFESAPHGTWDLLYGAGSNPDFFGENNGRASIGLFAYGKGVFNSGRYNNEKVNTLIDRALTARTTTDAENAWVQATAQVMDDAAIVPL